MRQGEHLYGGVGQSGSPRGVARLGVIADSGVGRGCARCHSTRPRQKMLTRYTQVTADRNTQNSGGSLSGI